MYVCKITQNKTHFIKHKKQKRKRKRKEKQKTKIVSYAHSR